MLQELRERLIRIELIVTAHWPSERLKAVRDAVAGGEPKVVKTEEDHPTVDANGHPKLANGTVAQWAEVPSADALLKAANAFIEKNGKKAFKTLLDKYKAGKLTEVAGDENQAKFMAELQG